eukprot:1507393-Pleurochrysis_carterae.AAC.1
MEKARSAKCLPPEGGEQNPLHTGARRGEGGRRLPGQGAGDNSFVRGGWRRGGASIHAGRRTAGKERCS